MRLPRPAAAVTAALVATVTAAGFTLALATTANAATALPTHVYAPYFETWNGDSLSGLAGQSGAKYLTLAFLQTASAGSCTVDWDGSTSTPVSSSVYGSDINTLRANGGDVIPSFGGYSADHGGTEIADSCTDVNQIAAAYENVVTTYGVTRLDLDTEDNSLTNSAGIDRRNKAIKIVEDWAASTGRTVQFAYTLPATPTGLSSAGVAVLQNAVGNGARVDVVNAMTFDYYIGTTQEMATDTESSANGIYSQLAGLYPSKTSTQLWNMIGVTEMPGIDDYGSAETFTTADATTIENWAVGKGLGELSIWALQRDNGGCPGTAGAGTCSGISQNAWYFDNTFEPFTSGGGTTTNDFSVSVSPSTASVTAGGSTTATVGTAVTSGSAQTVSLSATGAPSGVTVSLSPTSVTAGGTSTLSVATSASAAAGSYPITITGSAGSGSHSTTFTLTVGGGGTGGGGSLTNGGFESGSLSPWTCQSGSAVVSSPVHSGSHSLQVAPTSSQTGECDQTITLSANSSHTLTAWVQGNYAFVGVTGAATASTWVSASGWTQLTVPFTTGSSGSVTVYVHGWYAQGNVYADDISVS
ncbi:MAG TPA: carbohydrate binding domain-containing protein [Pseudonocardiaceae bacterium]|jgi:hypothetical protein|nr:carbohydrate binding domain-containing protein [Pseudonocardiaceae bacterium]